MKETSVHLSVENIDADGGPFGSVILGPMLSSVAWAHVRLLAAIDNLGHCGL